MSKKKRKEDDLAYHYHYYQMRQLEVHLLEDQHQLRIQRDI